MRCIEELCETLMKNSDQLRGPLASMRGHWAFSEKMKHFLITFKLRES